MGYPLISSFEFKFSRHWRLSESNRKLSKRLQQLRAQQGNCSALSLRGDDFPPKQSFGQGAASGQNLS
jgi:hypothetical protein